ncbi:MAG: bifunctional DNA-formamidopyrimidine glycosylase/DNA-(apurinic or apyrimidinic site) lyase [Planctomycetota bacterium]|nr:bifunctional DNA-formamidopyrimidine glycosylase/DNA-(apurinic or apyrimidinic site) lyase [Planctomycetota bacterium]
MPELPEVETVVRDLRPLLCGTTILSVIKPPEAIRRAGKHPWEAVLKNRHFESISRRGKWIIHHLDNKGHLLIHLGMTGQLLVQPKGHGLTDHLHMILALDQTFEWKFRDIRRFGNIQYFANPTDLALFWTKQNLGPEPFKVDRHYWATRLKGTSRNLKALLLDQTLLAGLGNIYADEALHLAKLHPEMRGQNLTSKQNECLLRAIENVLTESIKNRGSTIRDYVGGSGLKGGQQLNLQVYGRTDNPCFTCGNPIKRTVLAGRSTHFCPKCQLGQPRKSIES